MLFDACDADKIAAWKGEIESTIESMDSLRDEIRDYFATNGEHDPDAVLAQWDAIVTVNDGEKLWGAFVSGHEGEARAAAEKAGRSLNHGTPPHGYGYADWTGMTLWYVT